MPPHRRAIGYARVSSAEQALGTSLADQQAAIAAYAQERGLTVARFYVEAESGIYKKVERREQMAALMRDVRAGDLVVCDKIDRWSRDAEFTYGSVRKILEAGASFFAVADRIDPSTNEGDTALGFRILFAREEHKRIKERTVGTRNILRAKGYYVEGTPPFGYQRARPKGSKGVEKNVLVVVPTEAALVREMFKLHAQGESIGQIASALGLGRKRVWSSLRSRTYLGEVLTPTGWLPGRHEPIVSPELWQSVNATAAQRRFGGSRAGSAPAETDRWFLRTLARCGLCGAKMSAAYAGKVEKGTRRHYYRCARSCEKPSRFIPVPGVEKVVAELIIARLGELREELGRGPERKTPPKVDYAPLRTNLARRRERHLEAHASELMTLPELRAALAKVDAERTRLDAQEAATGAVSVSMTPEVRRSMLREIRTIEKAWGQSSPAGRRAIAQRLMTSVTMTVDGLPSPAWRPLEALVRE